MGKENIKDRLKNQFTLTPLILLILIFSIISALFAAPVIAKSSVDNGVCYKFRDEINETVLIQYQSNSLIEIQTEKLCVDWDGFETSENWNDIEAVYQYFYDLEGEIEIGVYDYPKLSYPFLRLLFDNYRDFFRDPTIDHDLSNILVPPTVILGFATKGYKGSGRRINVSTGLWFPNDEVLKRHVDKGIPYAEELFANRLLFSKSQFMTKVVNGDYSQVDQETYKLFKNNSEELSHSALIAGLYELSVRGAEGLSIISRAAEMGNKEAMLWLGLSYLDGKYVDQNLKQSLNWLEKASDNGSAEAKALLALGYKFGAFGEVRIKTSIKFLEEYIEALPNGENRDYAILLKDYYLTYIPDLNSENRELQNLIELGIVGDRLAVHSLCNLYSYGPRRYSEEYTRNYVQRNFQLEAEAKKWCQQSALLGIRQGAAIMLAYHQDYKKFPQRKIEEYLKWLIINIEYSKVVHGKPEELIQLKDGNVSSDKILSMMKKEFEGKLASKSFSDITKEAYGFMQLANQNLRSMGSE